VNLGTCDQNELRRIYKIVRECQATAPTGETIVDCDAARSKVLIVLRYERVQRFQVLVLNNDGVRVTTYVYTIMFYFEPSPCWFQLTNGTFCHKLHRTIFEYRDAHPSVELVNLGLSHLWHQSWDICPARIIIEPNDVNS